MLNSMNLNLPLCACSKSGVSNLFEPKAIFTRKKYWRAIQRKHPTFCTKIKIIVTGGSKKHCAGHSKSLRKPNLIKIEEKRAFTSNLFSTSAKIDRTEGFKKHCAGHSKPLRVPNVAREPRVGRAYSKLILKTNHLLLFCTSNCS